MGFIGEWDDFGFDLNQAKKSINIYSHSIGIPSLILDTYGNILYFTDNNQNLCGFCRTINNANCTKAQIYGSYQAERFGGQYIYFCPIGLVNWVSPIISNGMMKGAVLGGPVLMIEPEEFLIDEIIKNNTNTESFIAELAKLIHEIPVVKPNLVQNYAELLFIVTTQLSEFHPEKLLEDQAYLKQQKDISKFIHSLKTNVYQEQESYPIEKEKRLLTLIAQGDKSGSQKLLNEIFGYIFFSSGGNFNITKARALELLVLLSRAALEGGADIEQIFGLNYKYLSQIDHFSTFDELTYWLSKIMARFTDCVFNLSEVKHIDVIYKGIDYIKRNYMKKITLEDAATYVHLSPSYFCKVFKEETKLSFNSYLNQVRIRMSKNLLVDDSIPLIDVSSLVGFEDQSYFSKVFKKMTGVSPGKFREARGQI